MSIDPRMRLVCLMIFGAAVATAAHGGGLVGASLVGAAYVLVANAHAAAAWRMVKRMRWIFLSIIVFYFWFTPGHGITPVEPPWLPALEGVQQGLLRVLALTALILAVNLMLQTTPRDALLTAMLWGLRPLRWAGFSHERFAVRMTLVLHAVPQVQALIQPGEPSVRTLRERVAALGSGMSVLFNRVILSAEQQPLEPIQIESTMPLSWTQWLIPAALATLLALASVLDTIG